MTRYVTLHWTAGNYQASDFEKQFYHFLVDGQGALHLGKFKPADNHPPLRAGYYAAHCGGGNSYNIGVALCGMHGFRGKSSPGPYPLTRVSFENACHLIAKLCGRYGIAMDEAHVFTHYEFGQKHPHSSSFGKIDITWLPWVPELGSQEIGPYFRHKVRWYFQRLK